MNLYLLKEMFQSIHGQQSALLNKLLDYRELLYGNSKGTRNVHFSFAQKKQFEQKWKTLKSRYDEIALYDIFFVAFGETIARLFLIMQSMEQDSKKKLYVLLPTFYEQEGKKAADGMINRQIFPVFGKYLYFIDQTNIDFWTYIVQKHCSEINIRNFEKYLARAQGCIFVALGQPRISFLPEQIRLAEEKLREMGVEKEFIGLYARENTVKEKVLGKESAMESACRACSIRTYGQACSYLFSQNYQMVRFGKYENQECQIIGVIDYANTYYDEFMDFYLMSKCKFLLGSDGGLAAVFGFWGRPVLMVNKLGMAWGFESLPSTGADMYIPKKLWSVSEKRYFNLYEMLDIHNECGIYASNYKRRGIAIIDNTQEEILDAAVEMNERMDHRWTVTEQERVVMEKYWQIMDGWKRDHRTVFTRKRGRTQGYTMLFYQICYSFLKNNLYLLETDKREDESGAWTGRYI